jgi:hypothetical protein
MSDDELVKRLRKWLKEASRHSSKRRDERKKEWAALANDQWEEADLTRMSGQKRTTLTLNLLQTMLAAVEGEERTNRQEIKFYGEEEGDDVSAAAWNRVLKWIMDQCGGEFALSSQFRAGAASAKAGSFPTSTSSKTRKARSSSATSTKTRCTSTRSRSIRPPATRATCSALR